jgi:hypothetical protein
VDRAFQFTARLERVRTLYGVAIPAAVSRAIGRRGPVPVVAKVNGIATVQASIVPRGGGRHWLRLNARTRADVKAKIGAPLKLVLRVDDHPLAKPTPPDLARALRDLDLVATFERFPVGKRNHIIQWIEDAVADRTREKRIDMTIEVTLRAREKEHDRTTRAG